MNGRLCVLENGKEIADDSESEYFYPENKTFIFIAKSFYWHKQIESGKYKNSVDIAAADSHSPQYAKRSLRQRYLSPKIIEQIVSNKDSSTIGVDQLINFNHWDWQVQGGALLV